MAILLSIGGIALSTNAANPLEDNFGAAAPTFGVTNLTASNVLATAQPLEPFHAGEPPNHSLWATWTAPVTGTYSFSTSNSLNARRLYLDTTLAVYKGNSLTNLSLIASNDDYIPFNLWSRVFFRAHAGETFQIAVDVIGTNTNSFGTINLRIDQPLPFMTPWTAYRVGSGQISSQSYSNRILFADFWETTCSTCVAELPDLIRLYQKWQPRGYSMVGLSVDPDVEMVESYLFSHPVPYDMGMNSMAASNSLGGAVGMPVKYVVDQDGRIVARYIGPISPASETFQFYSHVLELLLRPSPFVNLAAIRQGGSIKISWPASDGAFHMEGTSDLGSANWSEVTGQVETNNGSFILTLPADGSAQFFRLSKP